MADGKTGKTGLRRYSFTLAFLAFILSLYSYFSFVAYAGFWDGYMSEQELRQNPLAPYFDWSSFVMGCWFVCLGIAEGRMNIRKAFIASAAIYLVIVAIAASVDIYIITNYTDSSGG